MLTRRSRQPLQCADWLFAPVMEGDFLLDRLDGGSHDNDLELQRQSPPAASSSALRSCYMAISQPPVVLCLDAALAVVSLTLVGFKLDNLPFAPSW